LLSNLSADWRFLTACEITPRLSAATAFTMKKQSHRLTRTRAGLVVVDVQQRLLPAIFEKERVLQNVLRLIQGAAILKVPVFATEQYPKGLGPTVPEVAVAIPGFAPREKVAFSACGAAGFVPALKQKKVLEAVLCGIEAHVCVSQTCLDLLDKGFRVFVVADAVSSRTPENCRIGLDRMRAAGAVIVSTEMVLFELLEQAGTAEFKQILALVK
jgi:nicotinamidase-related amidase